MGLDVGDGRAEGLRILFCAAEHLIAESAKKLTNLAGSVVMIDDEFLWKLVRAALTDSALTQLIDKHLVVLIERETVLSLQTLISAHGPSFMRVLLFEFFSESACFSGAFFKVRSAVLAVSRILAGLAIVREAILHGFVLMKKVLRLRIRARALFIAASLSQLFLPLQETKSFHLFTHIESALSQANPIPYVPADSIPTT